MQDVMAFEMATLKEPSSDEKDKSEEEEEKKEEKGCDWHDESERMIKCIS